MYVVFVIFSFNVLGAHLLVAVSDKEWAEFKETYNKQYEPFEDARRRRIYEERKEYIEDHNKKFNMNRVTYRLKINAMADMNPEEVSSLIMRPNVVLPDWNPWLKSPKKDPPISGMIEPPKSFDWRDEVGFTPIEDQLKCNSCWAFTSRWALEVLLANITGKKISLSVQFFVDCAKDDRNAFIGCKAAPVEQGFTTVMDFKGIPTTRAYGKYTGKKEECRNVEFLKGLTVTEVKFPPPGREEQLKSFLVNYGPVVVSINSHHESFLMYSNGIHFNSKCDPNTVNHALLLIGYGRENDQDYWIVKNSWGEGWGLQGYGKLARNKENNCGIATQSVVPIVSIENLEYNAEDIEEGAGITTQQNWILLFHAVAFAVIYNY